MTGKCFASRNEVLERDYGLKSDYWNRDYQKYFNINSHLSLKTDLGLVYAMVKKFTYLGVTLSSNGKYYQAQKHLAEQASRSLYTLNNLFENTILHMQDKFKLFDAMILPVLTYSSEIWRFFVSIDIERVHVKFLKQLLSVRTQTCNNAVYSEFGKVPLFVIRKERILEYCAKILSNQNSLIYKVYKLELNMLEGDNNHLLEYCLGLVR